MTRGEFLDKFKSKYPAYADVNNDVLWDKLTVHPEFGPKLSAYNIEKEPIDIVADNYERDANDPWIIDGQDLSPNESYYQSNQYFYDFPGRGKRQQLFDQLTKTEDGRNSGMVFQNFNDFNKQLDDANNRYLIWNKLSDYTDIEVGDWNKFDADYTDPNKEYHTTYEAPRQEYESTLGGVPVSTPSDDPSQFMKAFRKTTIDLSKKYADWRNANDRRFLDPIESAEWAIEG